MMISCATERCKGFCSSRGRGTGFAGPQAQRRPRGWSLGLQACLSRLGQATEAKRLASRGLQGLAHYTK
ncbi:MAG: hypothetical protein B7X59_00675 [Polaromonas sp. 39-63-203]|nr:MAG: hypothetical protein B7Y54_00520 [Polaromonas sp. 35-63-240]OYZ85072.1 MAG: hypothetical protein B7Y03_00890 [Polaromonas sp. 24-62-144]OZB02399.1 MAG: hypothetical protein B7X59_00675 [Polaromonas sp. 39-63-203]